jgi:hypothetical protein
MIVLFCVRPSNQVKLFIRVVPCCIPDVVGQECVHGLSDYCSIPVPTDPRTDGGRYLDVYVRPSIFWYHFNNIVYYEEIQRDLNRILVMKD